VPLEKIGELILRYRESSLANKLRIYMTIPVTHTLGPYARFAIWVQGCPFRCPGCMTPDSLPMTGGEEIDIEVLAKAILNESKIEGITISGGEPFLQTPGLVQLIDLIKANRDIGVIVYSGYQLKKLRSMATEEAGESIKKFLKRIDILIDGLYIKSLNDGLSLRGSSNQKVHRLTNRYSEIFEYYYGRMERQVEIHIHRDEMKIVGIPGQEMLQQWQSKFSKP